VRLFKTLERVLLFGNYFTVITLVTMKAMITEKLPKSPDAIEKELEPRDSA